MSARFSTRALRAWLVMSVVLCTSCAHLPIAGRGLHPTPGKSVGRPGCGPPISYQVFRQDAFGADWSKTKDLLAYNAKGSDGPFPHLYGQIGRCEPAAVRGGCSEFPATHHGLSGVEPVRAIHRVCRRKVETNLLISDSVIVRVALTCHGS
jgi:hypothetical protein